MPRIYNYVTARTVTEETVEPP